MRSLALLVAALASASANVIGANRPEAPVGKTVHARMLSEAGAPDENALAEYNIILFSSIVLVIITYFAMMTMVNMDFGNDSLLYSKSKSD